MAHCDEYLELISAAIDGALSPVHQRELDAHLAQCPQCAALMEELKSLHEELAHLPPVEPPADLTQRITAAVSADNVIPMAPLKKAAFRWKPWAAAAAVLAVVLMGSGDWWRLGVARSGTSADVAPAAAAAPSGALAENAQADSGGGMMARSAPEEAASAGAPEALAETPAVPAEGVPQDNGSLPSASDYAMITANPSDTKAIYGNASAPSDTASLSEEADTSDAPQSGDPAPMIAPFSVSSRMGPLPAVTSEQAVPPLTTNLAEPPPFTVEEAAWALANYIYEFVDTVERVSDEPATYAFTSPGASGTAVCVGEDELIYSFTYEDSEDEGVYRYSVAKADGSVTYLGWEDPSVTSPEPTACP